MSFYLNLKSICRHPFNRDRRRSFRRQQVIAHRRSSIAASLSRNSRRATILMVTHDWGGGTERHIRELILAIRDHVNMVILRIVENGFELTTPVMPSQMLQLTKNEYEELIKSLRAFRVVRMHVHQLMGQEAILRAIIGELALPFDVTVHDYYLVCPQIHLRTPTIPWYCGELGEQQCNECIARNTPFGARDIREWRVSHAWFAENAERVLCPSRDVRDRIAKYYPRASLVVAPHEENTSDSWIIKARPLSVGQSLTCRFNRASYRA